MKNISKSINMIEVQDWDNLVSETYKRPYSFQQQDGCKGRGTVNLTIPSKYENEEYMNDSVPELVNSSEMGVKFKVWLERDPNLNVFKEDYENRLFWQRNFYPDINTVANDLHKKGLIEKGDYLINIDW